ncbi:hypothetical protein L6Q96_12795 [Candidatus Binatia bacterium]|nr:hypothetical protein [Candidatus Binatia bacterium]
MGAIPKSPPEAAVAVRFVPWAVGICVALAEMGLLGVMAAQRIVNADEGFYALAGARVLGGGVPYADFFFPQMPYMPYLQAAAFAVAGHSLLVGRAVSVIAGGVLAGLMAGTATRWSDSAGVGVTVGAMFAAHALPMSYLPIVKPYAVAGLAAVGALVLLMGPTAPGTWRGLAAGACAALAVGARLPAAAVGPVLLLLALRAGWRTTAAFIAGGVLGSLPWLVVAAIDPGNFWFNNFGFHSLRREISGVTAIVAQKGIVLVKWLLLPQNALLWAGAAYGAWRTPRFALPPLACALAIGAVYMAATPTYLEYFVQVMPFLLLAAVPAVATLLRRRALLAAVAAVYLVGLVVARRTAPDDTGRGEKDRLWNLTTVQEVARHIEEHTAEGDRILSWWEGYPWLAHRQGYLGVGFWEANAARKVAPEARERYHLLHRDDVRTLVERGAPRMVVVPDGVWNDLQAGLDANYAPAVRFGAIQVFDRRRQE